MVRPAIFACCTMVTLPAPDGTAKVSSVPTLWTPSDWTCAAGNALVTIDRSHDEGVQAPGGTQAFPSDAQGWQFGLLEQAASNAPAASRRVASLVTGPPILPVLTRCLAASSFDL